MAVYTKVSAKALGAFLKDYDAGKAVSFKGIAEGVENSNYLLETTEMRAILTLYEKRADPADLPYYLDIMSHLAAKGVQSPEPIQDKQGQALKKLAGRPACMISFLTGVSTETPNSNQAFAVGELLATLHESLMDFPQKRPNSLSIDSWQQMIDAARDAATATDSPFAALHREAESECKSLMQHWPQDLPTGTIHADLFPDNILLTGDSVTGVIDFYFACTDALAYDLAVTLTAWCFDVHQTYLPNLAAAMIKGYESVRPLTATEKTALPLLCRGSCMRFMLTRLTDWFVDTGTAVVHKKDPRDYQARLRHFQSMTSF